MGKVYRARDTRLGRTVAIKILRPTLADPERASDSSGKRAPPGLEPPEICPVFDVGRHEDFEFLVMASLDGESLASGWREKNGPLSAAIEEVLTNAQSRSPQALDAAHRARHRPSRSQAGQHHADAGGRQAARLRPGEACTPTGRGPSPSTAHARSADRGGTILGTCSTWRPSSSKGETRTRAATLCVRRGRVRDGHRSSRVRRRHAASVIAAILEREPPPLAIAPAARAAGARTRCGSAWRRIPLIVGNRRLTSRVSSSGLLKHVSASGPVTGAPTPARFQAIWWAAAGFIGRYARSAIRCSGVAESGQRACDRCCPFDSRCRRRRTPRSPRVALRSRAIQLALAPDGRRVVFVASASGGRSVAVVATGRQHRAADARRN